MKFIRLGNNINIAWSITRYGEPEELKKKNVKVYLIDKYNHKQKFSYTIKDNVINGTFYGKDQECCGVYRLLLIENENTESQAVLDYIDCFTLSQKLKNTTSVGSDTGVETVELTSTISTAGSGTSDPTFLFKGIADVTSDDTLKTIQNEMIEMINPSGDEETYIDTSFTWIYIISDSTKKTKGGKVTLSDEWNKMIHESQTKHGASIGDFLVINCQIDNESLTAISSFNIISNYEAEAASGDYPGNEGLMSVWDKTQVNKIPSLETIWNYLCQTRSETDANKCIYSGIYPYVNTNIPTKEWGTIQVNATKDTDSNGYYSATQFFYYRGATDNSTETVWTRTIFYKGGDTIIGEWASISNITWNNSAAKSITNDNITIWNNKPDDMIVNSSQVILNKSTNTVTGELPIIAGYNNNVTSNKCAVLIGNSHKVQNVENNGLRYGSKYITPNFVYSLGNQCSFNGNEGCANVGLFNELTQNHITFNFGSNNTLSECGFTSSFGDSNTLQYGEGCIAVGNNNNLATTYSKNKKVATYDNLIGYKNTISDATYSTCLGFQNTVSGTSDSLVQTGVGIGYNNKVTATGGVGIGNRNTISGIGATAIGYQNTVQNHYEIALGAFNVSELDKTYFSIGNGIKDTSGNYNYHNLLYATQDGDFYIVEETNEDGDSTLYYKRPLKRLQTWLNEKLDNTKEISTSSTVTLSANKHVDITPESDLTITISDTYSDSVNQIYSCTITTGDTVGTITLPDNVNWGDSELTFEANKLYEISIRYHAKGLFGIIHSWNI